MSEEHTPPRGGAAYSFVEIGEMAKRAADNSHETKAGFYELKGVVIRHDSQLTELLPLVKNLTTPLKTPFYVKVAAPVAAAALFVIAIAAVTFVVRAVPPASAPILQAVK